MLSILTSSPRSATPADQMVVEPVLELDAAAGAAVVIVLALAVAQVARRPKLYGWSKSHGS